MAEQNLILTKESNQNEIKSYFSAILELSKSDNEFPINLDEVWMLVYTEKGKAVRALKEKFIEGVDYRCFAQNGKTETGGYRVIEYHLTVSCLEYFIARQVRPVFEVYRQVFHGAAKMVQKELSRKELLQMALEAEEEKERLMLLASGSRRLWKLPTNQSLLANLQKYYVRMVSKWVSVGCSSGCARMAIYVRTASDITNPRNEQWRWDYLNLRKPPSINPMAQFL